MKPLRLFLTLSVFMFMYAAVLVAVNVEWAWVILLIPVLLLMRKSATNFTAYGTARFAEPADLMGMLDRGYGLILGLMENRIGRWAGLKALFSRRLSDGTAVTLFLKSMQRKQKPSLVRLNDAVHSAVFAPTGAGKGASNILPFLLTCLESCVVIDFKGENYQKSAEARRRMGHKVVCLDPHNMVGGKDTFNPMDTIGGADDLNALDDIASMAKANVFRSGEEKEAHWNDMAETFIRAICGYIAVEADSAERNLISMRPVLSNKASLEAVTKLIQGSPAWGGSLALLGHQLNHAGEREAGSILTTVNRHTSWMDSPNMVKSLKSSSFNPSDICRKRMTIYLVLHPKYQTSHASWLRLIIDSFMRVITSHGLSKRKVHFILDEASSLGRMDQIESALDKYRGYGIRLQFYYQSIGQLKKCWAEGQEQTLLSNTTQLFYGINDLETAKYVSERLGEYTNVVASGGYNRGGSRSSSDQGHGSNSYGTSWSESGNWSQNGRRLMKPEELMTLPDRVAIAFVPCMPPIWAWMIRYYEGIPNTRIGFFKMVGDTIALFALALLTAVIVTAQFYPEAVNVKAFRIPQ